MSSRPELDHKVQVLNHILVSGLRLNFLISEEGRRVALIAGEKKALDDLQDHAWVHL